MKEKSLNVGVIVLSGGLVLALGLGLAKGLGDLGSSQLGQSNAFQEIQTFEAPISYETHIQKGDQFFAKGSYSMAAEEYALAIKISTENPEAYGKLGQSYEALEEPNKAYENFKRAYEISPNNPNIATHYGASLLHQGAYAEAKTLFDGITKETREKYFYLGLLSLQAKDHEGAKKNFENALQKEGVLAKTTVQSFLDAYASYNNKLDSLTLYRDALLTDALVKAKEYQLAKEFAQDVLKAEPSYRDVWTLLGYASLKMKAYQEAEDAFKEAKRLDSLKPEVHYFLGMSHFLQAEYEEAVQSFELAVLHHFEPEAELYKKLAESQVQTGAYSDALDAYEYLVKIDRSNFELFESPVLISAQQLKDLDRALSLAEDAVDLFPKDARSFNLLAWVYLQRNELDKAEENLNKGFSLNPKLPDLHFNSGLLQEAKDNKEQAAQDFKKAYELAEEGSSLSKEAAQKYNALMTNPQ